MCRIPETSSTYHCKESRKKWHGHNLQVSVWEPTAIRHGGLPAITSDKRVVVSQMSCSHALHERCTSGAGGLLTGWPAQGAQKGLQDVLPLAWLVAGYGKDHRGAVGERVRGRGLEMFVCVSAGQAEGRENGQRKGYCRVEGCWDTALKFIENPFLFIYLLIELPQQNGFISRLCLALKVTILLSKTFVLVLLPVCVTDLNEIVMVALPRVMLSLPHCSSPAGVWGLLLLFWAKHFSITCDRFPR